MADESPTIPPERALDVCIQLARARTAGVIARWLLHDAAAPAQVLALLPDMLEQADGTLDEQARGMLVTSTRRLGESLELLDRWLRHPASEPSVEPLDVPEAIGEVAQLWHRRRAPPDLRLEPPDGALPLARAPRPHVAFALLNLLLNARETLGDADRPEVRLRARADGDSVLVEVEDDGPGVAPEVLPRLFEPFVSSRLDRPVAGLGLFAARHLLRSTGGDLRHERPAGGGARFVLMLPRWGR